MAHSCSWPCIIWWFTGTYETVVIVDLPHPDSNCTGDFVRNEPTDLQITCYYKTNYTSLDDLEDGEK